MALSTISGTTGITDATITSAKLADFAAAVDLNGVELILDADQDTSITADTDDRIDFKIAGVEHFSFSNSSGDTIVKPMVDAKDIKLQQFDGRTLLDINDAGFVGIENGATGPGAIRIFEDSDLGSNYVGLSVGNVSTAYTLVFPNADGSSGQALTTNGSGVLSFTTLSANTPSSADGQALGSASLEWSDLFLADASTIQFGNDQDVILTHVADTGLLLSGTNVIQFNDASQNIGAPSATVLDINATDEIELNATLVDINANVEISGTATTTGVHTFTAVPVFPNNTIETADIQADAIDGTKIADDAINSEHYTDGSIDTAHIADGQITTAKLASAVFTGATDIGAAIADADLFLMDDGAGGTIRKTTASRIKTYIGGAAVMNDLTDVAMDITNFVDSIVIQTDSDGSAPTTGTLSGATGNIGIGKDVFASLTSGTKNVVFGYNAGDAIQGGSDNVIIGNEAGTDLTSANNNTFIGRGAGASITTGGSNVAIGHNAYNGCDAEIKNISIGQDALGGPIAGGEYNIGIGVEAGLVLTTGDNNTMVGYQAGEDLTTGENNVIIGNYAGNVLTTGSSNILVGYEADASGDDISHAITLGYNITSSSNKFSFGKNGDVVSNTFSSNANWSRSSDLRKKREIYDQGLGLDFINDLRTVNFQWKPQNEFPKEWNDYNETSSNDTEVVMHGFIAQEVKEALDKHASERDSVFAGWSKGEDGMQHTSREMFVIPLIKAVQELSAEVKELKAKLEDK